MSDSLSMVISYYIKKYCTRVRGQVASLHVVRQFSTLLISDIDSHVKKHTNMYGVDFEPFVSVLVFQFQLTPLQAEDLSSWT